jgi:beta-lactamase regulating signal transducer with metallopeptidase domain
MSFEHLVSAWDAGSTRWMLTLTHFLWQGLAVALAAAAALRLLPRTSASVRYALLMGTLVLMGLCPVVTFCVVGPAERPPMLATAEPQAQAAADPTAASPAPMFPDNGFSTESSRSSESAPAFSPPSEAFPAMDARPSEPRWRLWARAGAGLYLAGVLLLLARLTIGLIGGRRLCRRSQAVSAEVLQMLARQARALRMQGTPVVAFCRDVAVPTVVGVLRPTVLLPFSVATGLSAAELEAILAHELSHIRRYDHLANLLQRVIEAFLFFHPAMWWLSRQVRIEREHCCDDLVLALGARPLDYAATLLRAAELGAAATLPPAVAGLHVVREPSALRRRIARLLGEEREPKVRLVTAWPVAVLAIAAALAIPAFSARGSGQAAEAAADLSASGDPTPRPVELIYTDKNLRTLLDEWERIWLADHGHDQVSDQVDNTASSWGDPSGGLQARVLAVAPETDEQKPEMDAAKRQAAFAAPESVTLLVELKNVSDQPLLIQGTRYGDAYAPPTAGKSASSRFAPFLFDCEFLDKSGKPVEGPSHRMFGGDLMLMLSGGMAETVAPGKSLVVLVQPLSWEASMARAFAAGEYKVRVRYHGPGKDTLAQIKKHWPNKPLSGAWSGDVAAGEAAFRITGERKEKELAWGPPTGGLSAAVELRSPANTPQAARDNAAGTFPLNSQVNVRLHVKNVGQRDVSFWSETWRQDDGVALIEADGSEKNLSHAWYSGWANMEHWTLKPGQVAVLQAISLGIAADQKAAEKFEHPIGATILGKAGPYRLRYTVGFGGMQRKDADGKVAIPGEGDFTGKLSTGVTPITVRERLPEDEPPTFTARLTFIPSDKKVIEGGMVEVRGATGEREPFKGQLTKGTPAASIQIPKCLARTVTVYVRAPGYEETTFYDVPVRPDMPTGLDLTPALPLRFRLVGPDGKAVAGAKVRFFNRSKMEASSGPYPTDGRNGPVWAVSDAQGNVVLDTLQRIDPKDTKLGFNIYWFYVEPKGMGPLFLGPVQAGADLGEIRVGPLLEVQGEVRGTPQELANFSAEWDQPEPMKRGSGAVGWLYAESKTLETKNLGDRLSFRLTDLRPGKLRIISRFKQGGKSVSHVFTRREPNEDDVVFEIDLTKSLNDLVITSQPPKAAAWGKPSPKGIRLGIVLDPAKPAYRPGETVNVKLLLENSGKQEQSFAVPRLAILEKFGMTIDLRDARGEKLPWQWGGKYSPESRELVAGAFSQKLAPGESQELAAASLVIGGSADAKGAVAKLDVQPWQTCRLKVNLETYGYARDDEAGPLESNAVEFRVAQP